MITNRYNYYDILEVPTNAQQHEVTSAYERARATYSGENQAIYTIFSQQEARELLSMIEEAYSVLGNKTLRTLYDQRLFGQEASANELTFSSLVQASKAHLPTPKPEEEKPKFQIDPAVEKDIRERTDWDGQQLKKVREYKQIQLSYMSDKTKIKSYYLNAIENHDIQNLPAEVFIRGYVTQMSRMLGLNDKLVADSYMKIIKAKLNQ